MATQPQQNAANKLAADARTLKNDVIANVSQAIIIDDATNVYLSAQEAYYAAGGTNQIFIRYNPDLTNVDAANNAADAADAAFFAGGGVDAAADAASAAAEAAANAAYFASFVVERGGVVGGVGEIAYAIVDNANTYASALGITIVPVITPVPVDPSCFNEGTKILCLNKNLQEEYLPIETLRRGDFVKSYKHGYRRIDLIGKNPMINDPKRWRACMYKMEKTESNGLLEDLIVTGGHAVLVDELGEYKEKNYEYFGGENKKIDDTYLLLSAVSKDFEKLENSNLYTYYHFCLENDGNDEQYFGIWANGVLTEATSKKDIINHKYTLL